MSTAVEDLAPEAARCWRQLDAVIWTVADTDLVTLARTVAAASLGLDPVPAPPGVDDVVDIGADAARTRAVSRFVEQFCVDVSALDETTRAELQAQVGATSFDVVQATFVVDWSPRARRALGDLLGVDPDGWPETEVADGSVKIWPALEELMDAVIHIRALDPVTREVVRLRGARQHDCRLCKSRRSSEALAAGADEALFDAIDHAERSDLSDRHKTAIALVDAMIWQPAHLPPEVVDAVRADFTPVEIVDLVLNIMRNAMNKIAVALGADAPNVTEGVEIYAVDPT